MDAVNASLERIKAMFPAWQKQCAFTATAAQRQREFQENEAMARAEAMTKTDDLRMPLLGPGFPAIAVDNDVRVVVGPLVGKVTDSTAIVVVEVHARAKVAVLCRSAHRGVGSGSMGSSKVLIRSPSQWLEPLQVAYFRLEDLECDTPYEVRVGACGERWCRQSHRRVWWWHRFALL